MRIVWLIIGWLLDRMKKVFINICFVFTKGTVEVVVVRFLFSPSFAHVHGRHSSMTLHNLPVVHSPIRIIVPKANHVR